MVLYEDAVKYTTAKHVGQKRKNGEPYITHPLRIAERLRNEGYSDETVYAGLFHDLLEDTDATEEEIRERSNEQVLEVVKLLTKRKDLKEKEYIENILQNPIAKAVKNADRIDNLRDAMDGNMDFARRYAADTYKYYYGKFSGELDRQYMALLEKIEEK